ncbi:MAG: hypothetical protein ACJ8GJ_09615 [Vitreoscilla sp.]
MCQVQAGQDAGMAQAGLFAALGLFAQAARGLAESALEHAQLAGESEPLQPQGEVQCTRRFLRLVRQHGMRSIEIAALHQPPCTQEPQHGRRAPGQVWRGIVFGMHQAAGDHLQGVLVAAQGEEQPSQQRIGARQQHAAVRSREQSPGDAALPRHEADGVDVDLLDVSDARRQAGEDVERWAHAVVSDQHLCPLQLRVVGSLVVAFVATELRHRAQQVVRRVDERAQRRQLGGPLDDDEIRRRRLAAGVQSLRLPATEQPHVGPQGVMVASRAQQFLGRLHRFLQRMHRRGRRGCLHA